MEWEAPGIVLAAAPYGEGDALATVLTQAHGAHRGLAKGGLSRARANVWQPGNLVQVRWVARLHDQLGSFTAELVHPGAALAMDDAMALAILSSACAVAHGALTEREAHPRVFAGLLQLIVGLGQGQAALTELVRWEAAVLAELGYGMDLGSCALTGATAGLAFVSPRSGHAVCAAAAGPWQGRLLALPAFLLGDAPAGAADWAAGLALTGHFLGRDAFGLQHKPLPPARLRLADRVAALAKDGAGNAGPTVAGAAGAGAPPA
jgi:DNA repair protein RecO (recombination protein O)